MVRTTASPRKRTPSWVTTPTTRSPSSDQIVDRLLEERQIRLVFQAAADRLLVEHAVGLGPRRAHRRPLARIQHPELDPGLVGGERHRAAERVDLLDQVAFADAADRRVAGHLAEGLDAVGQQERAAAHAGGGKRGLGAGVAAADDDNVEFGWERAWVFRRANDT